MSRSHCLIAAANAVALGWCATAIWFHYFGRTGETWGYAVVDVALAAYFWRLSHDRVLALPLYYVHLVCIVHYLVMTLVGADYWWIAMIANRMFELEVIYLIGCSVFRLRRRARRKKEAPTLRPGHASNTRELSEESRPPPRLALLPAASMPSVRDDERRDARRFGKDHLFMHG
jgi:hypothetical protein